MELGTTEGSKWYQILCLFFTDGSTNAILPKYLVENSTSKKLIKFTYYILVTILWLFFLL
jgi:hypothetical protein